METAALCTVALGSKYVELACPVFAALVAAGNHCVVLTDEPAAFPTCRVLTGPDDGTHISHRKRIALRAGLENAQTAYWVEADSKLGTVPIPQFGALPPGVWSRFVAPTLPTCNTPRSREIFLAACAHFQIDPAAINHVHAGGFAISRDPHGVWQGVLDYMDAYSFWLRDFWPPSRGHSVTDRIGTGIATHLAGWTPQADPATFITFANVCHQLWIGDFRLAPPPV